MRFLKKLFNKKENNADASKTAILALADLQKGDKQKANLLLGKTVLCHRCNKTFLLGEALSVTDEKGVSFDYPLCKTHYVHIQKR